MYSGHLRAYLLRTDATDRLLYCTLQFKLNICLENTVFQINIYFDENTLCSSMRFDSGVQKSCGARRG